MNGNLESGGRPWFLDSVIYAIEVAGFADANGDGVGDLPGVLEHLDYLANLGVDCLWLLPTYISSDRDNGYDVVDHRRIEPVYGGDDAMDELIGRVSARGLHVMLDLIADHTSDQHPWFRAARQSRSAPERARYIFEQTPPDEPASPVFGGVVPSVWAYDERTDSYYRHRFYPFEPGLDTHSDLVQDEYERVLRHWIEKGVGAIRVDAASHLVEQKRRHGPADRWRPLRRLDDLGQELGVPLVGEADVAPERYTEYLGDEAGLDMVFNFYVTASIFLALARHSAKPMNRALTRLPRPPAGKLYVNFLRNLDELNLDQLSARERQKVYRAFAPKKSMRVYGHGIRRRVAPMLAGDQAWMELAWSLMFAMPGVPMLNYGDEIGLGEDLQLPERWAVRTTMQWDDSPHAGFSRAPDELVLRAPVPGGRFGYRAVNVRAQWDDPDSLLSFFRRLIALRHSLPLIAGADWHVPDLGDAANDVSAIAYRDGDGWLVALHNLADEPRRVRLPDELRGRSLEVIFGGEGAVRDGVKLGRYGYRWLRG